MAATDETRIERPARGRRSVRTSGDEREAAILQTAEQLLQMRSLGDIAIDDLARGAGISRSTFYFYFPSKDAVVLTLIDRMIEEAAFDREELLAEIAADPRTRVREGLQRFYEIFRAHRAVVLAVADEVPVDVGRAEANEPLGELARRGVHARHATKTGSAVP